MEKEYYENLKFITLQYGETSQLCMAMEECGELITSLNKYMRKFQVNDKEKQECYDNVLEEVSDVYVMLDQIKSIVGLHENDIREIMRAKAERQVKRINKQIEQGRLERK